MATQETAPIGAPCWIELTTPETGRACDFYAELFGWTTADQPQLSSENHFRRDGRPIAGYRNRSSGTSADGTWTVYLKCDDAAETVRSAVQNGGRVAIPATEVGDFGVLAQTIDPGGALVGAWQPGKHPGLAVSGEPGSPTWFELHTRDYDRVVPFYRQAFSWNAQTVSDTPEFRLTTTGIGDQRLAGIMDASGYLPPENPSYWEIYFAAADIDAALSHITSLGGSQLGPAYDTPFGRLAPVSDPTGAKFKLVGQD